MPAHSNSSVPGYGQAPALTYHFGPRLCQACNKPLQRIGWARTNGKDGHGDWKVRPLHKKCLIEKTKEEELMEYVRQQYFSHAMSTQKLRTT